MQWRMIPRFYRAVCNCAQCAAIFRGDRRSQFSGEICRTQHGAKNSKHPAPIVFFALSSFAPDSHTADAVLHLEPIGRAAELEPKGGGKVARIRSLTARETR